VAIHIDDFAFSPAEITGGTRHDHELDQPRRHVPHRLRRRFASDALDTGETFSYQFDQVCWFSYFCALHPRMQGVVTVR
jgi:plastocyanin